MSYQDGWSAIHLEMPARVPRTEYSADSHWEVVRRITGIEVNPQSPVEKQRQASTAFYKAWNYDFRWNILVHGGLFEKRKTDMGHAEYAAGGVDRNETVFCPFETPEEVLALDLLATYGAQNPTDWVPRFEKHYQELRAETPDLVNTTGVYVTLISGLIEIFGWEMLLLAAGTDPVAFGDLTTRYADYILPIFDGLAGSNVPVVMIHDDIVWTSGAIFPPAWYRQYVFPNLKRLMTPLRDAGKKIIFTSDGNYTEFIDDIAATGINGFVLEPTTDMALIAEKYGQTHVFIGNADTRILLSGSRKKIRAEVERCMNIGKKCPGFFMAVGNHIPANTPVENALYYNEVYESLSKR